MFNLKNRPAQSTPAFTLAEVLITLGIIGIVAAMTLPTLITSHIEKARITNLKKIYSQMQNAWNMAVYENGAATNWNFVSTNTHEKNDKGEEILNNDGRIKFMSYISPYFKKGNIEEIAYGEKYSLDGRKTSANSDVKTTKLDGTYIITADGFKLDIGWIQDDTSKTISDFWVYLPNEKKYITGVNTFHFYVDRQKGFLPDGRTQASFVGACNVKNKTIASNQNGRTCTAWALWVGNMEYLRCNDLSFNGKTKCK